MTIAFLIPEFPGQTHIFFWREMSAMKNLGIDVEVVSTRQPPREIISHTWSAEAIGRTTYLVPMGVTGIAAAAVHVLRAGPIAWARCVRAIAAADAPIAYKMKMLGLAFAGAELGAIARRKGWRHVHVHSCANAAAVAMFAGFLGGLRYSMTLHGPLRDYGPAQRQKWRHSEFAVVITNRLLAEVSEKVSGHLPANVYVAPMGVDLPSFRRLREYRPPQPESPVHIFSCGRLNPCKAHDDLIRAVAVMKGWGYSVRLVIAGEDASAKQEHRKSLERLRRVLGVEEEIKLIGAVSESRVNAELENAHIFALASHAEPLGVAIMEAMAMSVPVVVTSAGGVPELVRDGIDGLLVPPRDPEAMAAALRTLIEDGDMATRMGRSALERVSTSFGSDGSAGVLARALGALPTGSDVVGPTVMAEAVA
jgi:colanic acid/amylovoran biosynthesis glycosyltransferase